MDVKVLLVKLIKTQTFLGDIYIMKKTIIASSLAVGLGVVAGNAGHADASEAQVNKAELAQLAQSNDQSLNDSPIQEGAYNVTFDYEVSLTILNQMVLIGAGTMHNQVKLLNNKM